MQHPNKKSQLLSLIQTEHAQLETLLSSLSEEQMLRANVVGSWSVKDVLAHLTWWEQAMISEVLYNVELDPGLNGEPWPTERANELMVEAKRNTPLSEVLLAFHNSYQQLLQMVEGLTDKAFADEELSLHLANNTGNHYAEHRKMIESGLRLRDGGMSSSS